MRHLSTRLGHTAAHRRRSVSFPLGAAAARAATSGSPAVEPRWVTTRSRRHCRLPAVGLTELSKRSAGLARLGDKLHREPIGAAHVLALEVRVGLYCRLRPLEVNESAATLLMEGDRVNVAEGREKLLQLLFGLVAADVGHLEEARRFAAARKLDAHRAAVRSKAVHGLLRADRGGHGGEVDKAIAAIREHGNTLGVEGRE